MLKVGLLNYTGIISYLLFRHNLHDGLASFVTRNVVAYVGKFSCVVEGESGCTIPNVKNPRIVEGRECIMVLSILKEESSIYFVQFEYDHLSVAPVLVILLCVFELGFK